MSSIIRVDSVQTSTGGTATASGLGIGGVGKIGQVIQTTKTDTFSTSASSFIDITGLSLSITPTATSSKVLIKTCISWGGSPNVYGYGKFVRGSTDIFMGDYGGGNRVSGTFPMEATSHSTVTYNCFVSSSEFLDSPSSNVQLNYKIQVRTHDGSHTFYVNRPENNNNNNYIGRFTSTITAMEVLA